MYLQITPRERRKPLAGVRDDHDKFRRTTMSKFFNVSQSTDTRLNPCSAELRVNDFVFKYFDGVIRYPIIWQAECTHSIAGESREHLWKRNDDFDLEQSLGSWRS